MKHVAVLVTLGLVLTACGGAPGGTSPRGCSPPAVQSASLRPTSVLGSPLSALQVFEQSNWQARRTTGEVLVFGVPGGPLSAQSVGSVGALQGLDVQYVGDGLARVATPAGETDEAFAERLARQGLKVQPNYLYTALAAPVPNDPGYPANSGIPVSNPPASLPDDTKFDQDYLDRINAKQGWDVVYAATCASAATTAVLDTGVNVAHEDLQGRLLSGYDACPVLRKTVANGKTSYRCEGDDSNPSEVTEGAVGHGTSSIGIIGAATANGKGIAGLTWSGRNIYPVKVFGDSSDPADNSSAADTVSVTKGLNWAVARGVRVVNLSLGLEPATTDAALGQAIQAAVSNDVVIIAAAGNNATNGILYPASDPNVIAVGAVGRTNALAAYSARRTSPTGRDLDIVAPGGSAAGDGFDILSLGAGTTQYQLWAGTSEAAPQVAGAAALMRAFRPDLTAQQVRTILTETASGTISGTNARLLNVGAAMNAARTR